MTTITSWAESGEAAMVMASVGITEDGKLLEESPLAAPLQK